MLAGIDEARATPTTGGELITWSCGNRRLLGELATLGAPSATSRSCTSRLSTHPETKPARPADTTRCPSRPNPSCEGSDIERTRRRRGARRPTNLVSVQRSPRPTSVRPAARDHPRIAVTLRMVLPPEVMGFVQRLPPARGLRGSPAETSGTSPAMARRHATSNDDRTAGEPEDHPEVDNRPPRRRSVLTTSTGTSPNPHHQQVSPGSAAAGSPSAGPSLTAAPTSSARPADRQPSRADRTTTRGANRW